MRRIRLAVRPLVGAFVSFVRPAPPILPPVRFFYVVRHPRLAVYWRDPYGRYKRAGDPRSDWTPELRRAYRFAERHHATAALVEAGETGHVIVTNRN